MKTYSCFVLFALVACSLQVARAQEAAVVVQAATPIRILAWNVQSGGADPELISSRLGANPYDIYALSEVDPGLFDRYRKSCGEDYQSIDGQNENGPRLQIVFSGDKFKLVEKQELNKYRDWTLNNGAHRPPLVARLRVRETGQVFQVMTVHLARNKEEVRNEQAKGLREWARDQTLPTILIGDCNMDFEFKTERGNQAFIEILRDDVWQWVRPAELIDSNYADFNGDGQDDFPGSLLDFAFVAGPAKDWKSECKVIVTENDFPDGPTKSDHRPIELILLP